MCLTLRRTLSQVACKCTTGQSMKRLVISSEQMESKVPRSLNLATAWCRIGLTLRYIKMKNKNSLKLPKEIAGLAPLKRQLISMTKTKMLLMDVLRSKKSLSLQPTVSSSTQQREANSRALVWTLQIKSKLFSSRWWARMIKDRIRVPSQDLWEINYKAKASSFPLHSSQECRTWLASLTKIMEQAPSATLVWSSNRITTK